MSVFALATLLSAQTPVTRTDDDSEEVPSRERRLVQRLEQAKQLLGRDDAKVKTDASQATRLLQSILDEGLDDDEGLGSEDVLLEDSAAEIPSVSSLKSETRKLLSHLPSEARQNYETQFGKGTAARLEEAKLKADWRGIEEVSRRWPATIAGTEATWIVAQRALDQGQFFAAARRFDELRDIPAVRAVREPGLSLRSALAWRLGGRADRCLQVLLELKGTHGKRPVPLERGGELSWFQNEAEALAWLDRWAGLPIKPARMTSESRNDWHLAFGGPSRNRIAAGAVPVEFPIWSHGLLDSDEGKEEANGADQSVDEAPAFSMQDLMASVRVELRASIEQRFLAGRPVLPTAQPIVVDDAVIVRTMTQLQAFRLSDGRLLWTSAAVDSRFAEQVADTPKTRKPRPMQSDLQSLVQQRAWDDFSSASLSSDGEFVYSLHDRTSGSVQPSRMLWRGMLLPQESNTLVAIEARTGRMIWEIGGPRSEHAELGAQAFILGPPLPWNGELFALTDDGIEVRLIVLSPADGRLLWSQTLASSDPVWGSVARDVGLSPSIAGDCLICPTGAGSIVAIDPLRRELRWQTKYRESIDHRLPRRRIDFHAPSLAAETWWQQSVILVAGDKLLIASPDHGELLCLDADSGRLRWKQNRGDSLFLAGLADLPAATDTGDPDAVLVVAGHNELHGLRVSTGEPVWTQSASVGPLLGRGVLIDGVLHQPVSDHGGEVVSVETRTGRVLVRSAVPRLLGNLIAVDGRLISQSTTHVASFPSLQSLQGDLAKELASNADDAHALEERGRIRLHLGQRMRGVEDLRRAVINGGSIDSKRTLAALLLEELRLDRATDIDATIRELETLVEDPKQRLQFARLRAQGLQQRGELLLAARELLKLADAWEPTSDLESFGSGAVRSDRWTAARLVELRGSLPAEDQRTFDAEVATRMQAAMESTGPTRLRHFLTLFGWSESAGLARRALLEKFSEKRHRHQFESLLLAMRQESSNEQQAFATAKLAQHWLSLEQFEVARPAIDELATRFSDVKGLDKQTGRELAELWRKEFHDKLLVKWPQTPFELEKTGVSEPIERTYPIDWATPPDTFHENWSLMLDAMRSTLIARDALGREVWRYKLPLEEHGIAQANGNSAAWLGRWLTLNLGDRFLVLDTIPPAGSSEPAPRFLWQAALFDRRIEIGVTPLPVQQPTPIDGTPTRYLMTDSSGRRLGRVTVVSEDVVCFQTGSRLLAAELVSGDLLWTFDGLPAGCELSGDRRGVVAVSPDRREYFVFNTIDGRLMSRQELGMSTLLATFGRNVLMRTSIDNDQELRLRDSWAERDLFRERFSSEARPSLSLRDTLAVLDPSGRFVIWSLTDGRQLLDQTLPPVAHVSHLMVLRDRERWLLLTQVDEPLENLKLKPRVSELYYDHWKVHGPCFAFDRATGKRLWSDRIEWQGINMSQPAESPVLLLAVRVFIPKEGVPAIREGYRLRIELLDKRTGQRKLVSEDSAIRSDSFCVQRPNIGKQTIDLAVDRALHKITFGASSP